MFTGDQGVPGAAWESFKVTGRELGNKVQQLIAEGNVRRIRIRQGTRIIAEFPLSVGLVGTVFAPILAAVGALAAFLAECTVDVERVEPEKPGPTSPSA